jgi:hypothetical protein
MYIIWPLIKLAAEASMQNPSHAEEHRVVPITIDEVKYNAPSNKMTGQQLRNVPQPPVPANRDLWLEEPGPKDDELIRPEGTYEIKPGSRYYTAPSTINPGAL